MILSIKLTPVVCFTTPFFSTGAAAVFAVVLLSLAAVSSAFVSSAWVSPAVSFVANDTIGVSIKHTSPMLSNLLSLPAANSMHHLSAE